MRSWLIWKRERSLDCREGALPRVRFLATRYQDLPLGYADAAVIACAPARTIPDEKVPCVISDRAMLTLEAIIAYQQRGAHCLGPLDPFLGQGAVRRLRDAVTDAELVTAELDYRPAWADRDLTWLPYHGVQRRLSFPIPGGSATGGAQRPGGVGPAKARLDA
jgi:hypothetical protein